MEKRRVVITGMGTVNPLGHNVADTWQAVRNGVCGIAPITQYDAAPQKVHLAAEVKDWDPTAVLDKKVLLILSLCKGLSVTIPVAEAPAIQTVRQLAEALYERVNL